MLKAVALVLAALTIIFLLQNRAIIAGWIAGQPPTASGWVRIRRTLAEIWHLFAILYILGIYLIYALHMEGGFTYVLRATVLSLIIIVAARLLARFVQGLSRRGFAIKQELKAQFPTLEQRANRYIPILTGLASAIIYILALLAVLQAWNVGAFAWFGSELGRRVTGNALSIGMVVIIALALWEISASAIERYLTTIDASDAPRRTRIRTLLPLMRTALLCVIIVVSSLMILSHLGIDIAPLLAGAGVAGLAIGFGSQAPRQGHHHRRLHSAGGSDCGRRHRRGRQRPQRRRRGDLDPYDPHARYLGHRAHGSVQRGDERQEPDQGILLRDCPDRHFV